MFNLMLTISNYYENLEEQKYDEARFKLSGLAKAQAWDPNMKFEDALLISADSYKPKSYFKVKPTSSYDPNMDKKGEQVLSPNQSWCYRELTLKKGEELKTALGNRKGLVQFDGDILIPALYQRKKNQDGSFRRWEKYPWMSLTPMEAFTMRAGTKMARGHVVVAGLGMGYQLEQVCAKRNVKKVTLIEKDQEIVDWILPLLDLGGKEVEVVIGDANEIVPTLECDVALVDIYPSYGGNGYHLKWECEKARKVGKLWVWGSA